MVVKLGTMTPAGGIPMVELATINQALLGGSPDYLYKKIKQK